MSIIVWLFKTENQGHANLPTSSWLEFASVPSQGPAAGPISPQKRVTYDPSMWSESESPSVFIICARKRSIYPKFGYITSPVASKMVNLDIWTTVMISRGVYVTFQWLYNIGLVMN